MNWFFRLLRPAPHIDRCPDQQVKELYPKFRWKILESTFIGYATFYLVRNNLPVVSREMGQALSYSKGQIGDILALTAISYGIGRFFMGAWSDRSNPRYFMPLGLVLTALCNFAFATASSYPIHLFLWGLNGVAQGMGWAPCGRSLSHWYSLRERGTVFGFWNLAQNVGGGLIGLIAAYCTVSFGWRSAFYVPGALALLCAVYLLVRLRDTPQSVGLPPIEQFQHEQSGAVNGECEEELGTRDLLVNYILKNRYLWIFAGANFFAYIARYSMLDWGPTYLKEVKHASLAQGGFGTATLEFSAMFSTILVGWVSDKVGGSRGRICAICMIPVLLSFICILYSSDTSLWLDIGLFGVIGFFVYPAVMLLGICALDCSSKKAVGTANGFISIFGSLGRMVEGKGIGVLVERYGWNTALRGIMISTLLGIALLSLTWKLSPHNAKAGKAKKQNVPVEV